MYRVFFLAKFFDNPKYAEEFVRGKIYANPLNFFRQLEGEDTTGREDPNEGILAWLQPDQIRMVLEGMEITGDLAGPVEVRTHWANFLNAFCLHTGHSKALDVPDPSSFDIEHIRQELLVPDECSSFGHHAVIIRNAPEFVRRVNAARPASTRMYGGLVEYYDPDTFSGHFEGLQPAFRKHQKYHYQREYRLVFESPFEVYTPLEFDVGDLTDITMRLGFAELNCPKFLGSPDMRLDSS